MCRLSFRRGCVGLPDCRARRRVLCTLGGLLLPGRGAGYTAHLQPNVRLGSARLGSARLGSARLSCSARAPRSLRSIKQPAHYTEHPIFIFFKFIIHSAVCLLSGRGLTVIPTASPKSLDSRSARISAGVGRSSLRCGSFTPVPRVEVLNLVDTPSR